MRSVPQKLNLYYEVFQINNLWEREISAGFFFAPHQSGARCGTSLLFMNSSILRKKFLDFFAKRGHVIVPSSSLIPSDLSCLFTTAGMQQFKPYYLREKSPYGPNVASCQKCFRTSDIEEVGDEKHLTFLEMLGNFSFGGYFKEEAIKLALEFLIENCKLQIENLKFTYFQGDKGVPKDLESKKI